MSGLLGVIADAALPLAIGFVVLATLAFVVLQTERGDERMRRLAARALEPLAAAGAVAAVIDVIGLVIAADGGPLSVALSLALFAGAVGLWAASETAPLEAAREEPTPPAPAPVPEPAPTGSLWARPDEDRTPSRSSLWSDG